MPSYTYMIGSLCLFFIWNIIFILRKDLRQEMVIMGFIGGFVSLMMGALVWTKDWWKPPTLTGTSIGIEDFLAGFAIAGVSAVIYQVIFFKQVTLTKKPDYKNVKLFLIILAFTIILSNYLWLTKKVNSSILWLTILIPVITMYFMRRDLIWPSFFTGIFITIGIIPIYLFMYYLEPTLFTEWWLNENLIGITFLRIPIEDIVWFFTAGLFTCPLYKFLVGKYIYLPA